jgi:hypothetical protein
MEVTAIYLFSIQSDMLYVDEQDWEAQWSTFSHRVRGTHPGPMLCRPPETCLEDMQADSEYIDYIEQHIATSTGSAKVMNSEKPQTPSETEIVTKQSEIEGKTEVEGDEEQKQDGDDVPSTSNVTR